MPSPAPEPSSLFPPILPTSVLCFTHLFLLPELLSSLYPILGGACSCVVVVLTISFRAAYLPRYYGLSAFPVPPNLRPRMQSCQHNTCPSEQMESGTLNTPYCPQQQNHYCHLLSHCCKPSESAKLF